MPALLAYFVNDTVLSQHASRPAVDILNTVSDLNILLLLSMSETVAH